MVGVGVWRAGGWVGRRERGGLPESPPSPDARARLSPWRQLVAGMVGVGVWRVGGWVGWEGGGEGAGCRGAGPSIVQARVSLLVHNCAFSAGLRMSLAVALKRAPARACLDWHNDKKRKDAHAKNCPCRAARPRAAGVLQTCCVCMLLLGSRCRGD